MLNASHFRFRRTTSWAAGVTVAGCLAVGGIAVLPAASQGADFASAGATVRVAAGPKAADILDAVNEFRTDLGGGSEPAANGAFGGKRREINWDAVPDQFASPNDFPLDFFNTRSPRGAVFSTPGLNFQVSAKASVAAQERFANLNRIYARDFSFFSSERIFAPIASTTTDVVFFVPGTRTAAAVRGFGAVFTDVDSAVSTFMQFRDRDGKVIVTIPVPASPGNGSLSFAGATLTGDARIAQVRIVSGGQNLADGTEDNQNASRDKVAMDDFLYSEPVALPPKPAPVVAPTASSVATSAPPTTPQASIASQPSAVVTTPTAAVPSATKTGRKPAKTTARRSASKKTR